MFNNNAHEILIAVDHINEARAADDGDAAVAAIGRAQRMLDRAPDHVLAELKSISNDPGLLEEIRLIEDRLGYEIPF